MKRIESVDVFRLIAIVAVIIIHTSPFRADVVAGNQVYRVLDLLSNQLSRFAVPFFFIISGFFWGSKIRSGGAVVPLSLNMAKRLVLIWVAWSLIYLLPYNVGSIYKLGLGGPFQLAYANMCDLAQHPVNLLMQGTRIHLWFLVSMVYALLICCLFVRFKHVNVLVGLSVALYVFGVLAKAYVDTPIGLHIDFDTRNGPFFSTLPFLTGYGLSGKKINTNGLFYGLAVFCAGCLVHFSEVSFLWVKFGTCTQHDYVFGTYFMGLGIAMVALSNHPVLRCSALSRLGQMTLGIYAIHLIFVDILSPIDQVLDSFWWEVGYVVVVLALSVGASWLLSLNKYFRQIV